jgi:hypothetical protein
MGALESPERVIGTLKAWATRRLVDQTPERAASMIWSRHGSTRYLWNERALDRACEYVLHAQGERA